MGQSTKKYFRNQIQKYVNMNIQWIQFPKLLTWNNPFVWIDQAINPSVCLKRADYCIIQNLKYQYPDI